MAATLENSNWVKRKILPNAILSLDKSATLANHKYKLVDGPLAARLSAPAFTRSTSTFSPALAKSLLMKRLEELNNSPLVKRMLKLNKTMSIPPVPLIIIKR
ncbi:hypothetical protein SAMN03159284_05381 [Mucilaginibacter sp. NFR10]|nr:hypothetical protein SAMN03159284_05381 [Mucilaginibacter sp. NFR10]